MIGWMADNRPTFGTDCMVESIKLDFTPNEIIRVGLEFFEKENNLNGKLKRYLNFIKKMRWRKIFKVFNWRLVTIFLKKKKRD